MRELPCSEFELPYSILAYIVCVSTTTVLSNHYTFVSGCFRRQLASRTTIVSTHHTLLSTASAYYAVSALSPLACPVYQYARRLSVTMPALVPRDNAGYALPFVVIVLIIIFAALCLVICGYAIHRTFGFKLDGNGFKPISVAQADYMAEVRVRNMEHLAYEGRRSQWTRNGKGRMPEEREE